MLFTLQVALGKDQISALSKLDGKPGAEQELECHALDALSWVWLKNSHYFPCRHHGKWGSKGEAGKQCYLGLPEAVIVNFCVSTGS